MKPGDRVDEELAAVGAILVEDRLLRRLIKRHRHVPGLGLQVPHADSYALARAELVTTIDPTELTIDVERLPDRVAVITGRRADLARGTPAAWSKAWRAIFHAHVHHAFDAVAAGPGLGPAAIRQRINAIGQTEFDEARLVLRQEDLLLPPADDTGSYVEFVALYLELRHFAPHALAKTFPILHRVAGVVDTIALDVDDRKVLAAARPARAPQAPLIEGTDSVGTSSTRIELRPTRARFGDRFTRRAAEVARARGNHARAAILAVRAGERDVARADLEALTTRLGQALGGVPTTGWASALLAVADVAAAQPVLRYTASARLLLDLQLACVDGERDVEVVDALTWARSLGKRAIVRKLPATREIRVARRVRSASKKLAAIALPSADDRQLLADTIHAMVERANTNVRIVLRPTIEAALDEVGLRPRHLPGRVAQKKLVDELLDRAVAVGRLSIGNLRDAIAHNELKLPDLKPMQLVREDQLLQADKILAGSLDGVYRRGDIYLRFLQKVSSVLSGTALGRLVTLYVLLPVVGAFFVVEGVQHMVAPVATWTGHGHPELATTPAFIAVGVLAFLLLHASWFRRWALMAVRVLGAGLRMVFLDSLRWIWRVPLVRPLVRFVLMPAAPALLTALLLDGVVRWPVAGVVFLATAALINSSAAEEVISDWLLRSGRHLAQRILPGLIKYALELFGWLTELSERFIYRVDELLRFRPNQSPVMAVVKGVLGTIWFAVSYLLRIYVNLLIEPTVNPVKHFPVVTVAAKLILPFIPQMTVAISDTVAPVFGSALGASIGAFTVLVLPGIAGFLAWELNSNWKLYRHNRRAVLGAVAIGSHGETMAALLKPGFHSGTVPKLYAKLRRATWKGQERAVARASEGLHHVEDAVWKFADRQLVSMLNQDLTFRAADVAVDHVDVGSNRLRIDLICPSVAAGVTTIAFEEQSSWLVAGMPQLGWLAALDPGQRKVAEIALAGFYKLCGVDVVREQIEDVLIRGGLTAPAYDFADDGLVVWPGPGFDVELVYDIRASDLTATVRGEDFTGTAPTLIGEHALFGREPIQWTAWAMTWERLALGMEAAPILIGPSLLGPAAPPPATPIAPLPETSDLAGAVDGTVAAGEQGGAVAIGDG